MTAHRVQRAVHLTVRRLTRRLIISAVLRHPRVGHVARRVNRLFATFRTGRHLQRLLHLLDDGFRLRLVLFLLIPAEETRARLRTSTRPSRRRQSSNRAIRGRIIRRRPRARASPRPRVAARRRRRRARRTVPIRRPRRPDRARGLARVSRARASLARHRSRASLARAPLAGRRASRTAPRTRRCERTRGDPR